MAAFWEAFKGAQVELQGCTSARERLATAFRISRILVTEAGGALSLIPYGLRAWRLYTSLPRLEAAPAAGPPQHAVLLAKDIRYGPKERNLLDLYIPAEAVDSPVALFCHGGVWATGERWHYAPMAVRLAQGGVMTAVASYSLYPRAQAADMVRELSTALTWTLDHARSYGGDPDQVSALGHSAGAQLLAMVLLHRARAARGRSSSKGGGCAQPTAGQRSKQAGEPGGCSDARMPARFIGMAGVFDIAKHYEYEAARGVQYLSTMERAVGGRARFADASPAAILARAAPPRPADKASPRTRARLQGEAIAERVGFHRHGYSGVALGPLLVHAPPIPVQASATAAAAQTDSPADGSVSSSAGSSESPVASSAASKPALDFRLEDARRLPPFWLMSSLPDATVPWYESAEMFWRLQDCGVPARHLVYSKESHADFVIAWRPLRGSNGSTQGGGAEMSDLAADLLAILTGKTHEDELEAGSTK